MKSLKPVTIMLLGPLLMGAACVAVGTALLPDMRTPRMILIVLVLGAALGSLVLAPLAAGEAFRAGFVRRHFQSFDQWSSLLGAMGLGHLLFFSMGDKGLVVAGAVVFACAAFRMFLSVVAERPRA